jgi:hemoglobin/transferrin/lactoferrin receptor protein
MAQDLPPATGPVVRGRVVDASGAALAGASVTLRQAAGALRVTATDANGAFVFSSVPPGQYRLSAEFSGFAAATAEVRVRADEETVIDLALQPGTITEKVTVTASRAETLTTDTPVPVSVVNGADLERRALNTVGDLFRYLPGVSTAGEGPFQVRPRIRGLDSNRVLILVDGERLNNARTSTANSGIEIGLADIDQVERVEVARGSGSVLYGTDALAGTINIITRDTPPRLEEGFRLGGGFNGFFSQNETGRRGSAFVTGTSRRFAFRAAQTLDRFANYHTGPAPSDSGQPDASDAATEVPNSQYHGSNTQLVGRYFLNDEQTLRVGYERRRAANIGVPALVGVFNAYFPFSNRDKVNARYEAQNLTAHLARIAFSAYYQKQDRNFTNILTVPPAPPAFPGSSQFSETITRTRTFGFDAQSNWVLGQRNVLIAGASYFRDRNRDGRLIERLSPDFRVFPPRLVRSEDRSKSVPDATFSDLAFFAQDEWEATRRLRLIAGLRADRFDIDSEPTEGFSLPAFLTPSQIEDLKLTGLAGGLKIDEAAISGDFGLIFRAAEILYLSARIGRSFREPNLFERFFTDFGSVTGFVVGNPDLKPESGVNVDLSIRMRTARLAGSLTYFNNTYTNFLTSRPAFDRTGRPITVPGSSSIPVFQTVNLGRTRIQGMEADFEAPQRLAGSFITLLGHLSYLRGDDLQGDVPLDFITPLKAVAGLRWQEARDRFWAEYGVRFVTTQERLSPQFLVTNGGAEPGFAVHDIHGGYNLRRERYAFGVTLGVTNLLNRYYREQFVFAPARGRSVAAGLNLRFF